jgi:hypothetical protein
MRSAEPLAHPGGLRLRAWQMAVRLFPRTPTCAFCPGTASEGWMIDPLGRAHGICGHCLERMRAQETARK